jgi:D-sedoheptulose 7-phosphate isomerase
MSDALTRLRLHAEMAQALAVQELAAEVEAAAAALAERFAGGGRLLIFGNGGSAADAQHLAAELTGRYLLERAPLSAIALADNTAAVSAIANDYGYDQVFARQVVAHGGPGDAAVALSTSGSSPNVLEGLRAARTAGLWTLGVTGPAGEPMRSLCDQLIVIPAADTPHIQEGTMLVLHTICELVEERLFGG